MKVENFGRADRLVLQKHYLPDCIINRFGNRSFILLLCFLPDIHFPFYIFNFPLLRRLRRGVRSNLNALYNYVLQNLNQSISKEVEGKKHGFHTDDEFGEAPIAPTATPTPEITEEPVQTLNPDATAPSDVTPAVQNTGSSMSTTDVLIVVFFTLAGVAILAVIIILINYAVKNGRNAAKTADAYSSDSDADDDDGDGEDTKEADEAEDADEPEDAEGSDDSEMPGNEDKKAESKDDEDEKSGDNEE